MGRKWANIVAKKTAKDGANSKVYAKFGVEIYVAAKQGEPDPESNSALKFVLERAKQAQVPKHVIDKAIDKAKGNTDETFVEGRYEGFGPNGSMIIVDTLTSNVNRTAANVRTAFGKNGGNMGASGSVSYLFDNKGVIVFAGDDADAIFELAIALSGYLNAVNPFNQPGVEAYKKNMFALLGKPGFEELGAELNARL